MVCDFRSLRRVSNTYCSLFSIASQLPTLTLSSLTINLLTTGQTPWLNGKHVVFGKVTDGLDIVKKIEVKGSEMGRPRAQVQIKDCGVVE
mmetsp:Transcript_34270/g.82536  ORF Transcript_34270/g.82536 Transcript_34270/m.82536 type:complete len:90 (-) Transcript_34270:121-390(-)